MYVVLRGESRLKRTQATAEMDSFGDAPRKNVVTRFRLELEVGSRILIKLCSKSLNQLTIGCTNTGRTQLFVN